MTARATNHRVRVAAIVGLSALLAAACGSSGSPVVRAPSGGGSTTAVTSTAASSAASSTPPGSPSGGAGGQHVTVTPARQLTDGQHVQVHGTGFTAGEALQVIECADKGTATGPSDCNLPGMLATAADNTGSVAATLTVVRGPFGGNKIVCSAAQPCLISVTQASLSPTEEADAPISFAG
jgi:hypothetical protein